MSDEFLQSSEFADALRPVYEPPPGKGAALAIAGIYDALSTQDAKDALRGKVLRHPHLRKRFTPDGIKEIGGGEERQDYSGLHRNNCPALAPLQACQDFSL